MRWRCTLAALALALAGHAHAATGDADTGPLVIAPGLAPDEAAATRELLDNVLGRLPARWRGSLGLIEVQWREDLPEHIDGRALASRLLLDRALLDDWMQRPASADIDHPATRAALAAVIHELAHFHDRSPTGGLSRDPRLLDLAGWQISPMRLGLRHPRNAFTDRSPDRYELESPAEFVAVNLEHFLLDPQYGCRRPALHRHFAAHFEGGPMPGPCAPDVVFLRPGTDADTPVRQLDPTRVYQVDYLLAEGNDRFMSRWGHSMLRLVVCAPGRPPGPECRLDLDHHLVLSFRAFVDDMQISSWRGLTGSYPSRLFVLPLAQVVEEYTRVELRGLQSIPLRLGPAEITGLVERAAQLHWSYDGRYYFVSNNCAVETFKLLHDGVPRLTGEPLASITPTGLRRRLVEQGIADAGVLDDRDEARRLGYYFEAADTRYQAMFDIARESLGLPQARVTDWLDLPAAQRTPWLARSDLRSGAALLLLENAALRRRNLLARDELKRRFLGDDGAPRARQSLDEVLQLEGLLGRPAAILQQSGVETGYGLPQATERDALERDGAQLAATWRAQSEDLRRAGRALLPAEIRADIEATEANIALLGDRLRELHRDEGGLRLDSPGAH
ncbi:DUF4105 domain-containing protein [Novilysobacter arseniciresistens]|uniref:DUF7844 domain-containing protein n=1 Tax=Novilysobacter arseniciresistens TaxID=1385522 RepID=UPI000563D74C|nr:DUF4105 domain-containing protein [Lysobacter arseniciresistens]